jgi:hypothetical protein
MQGTVLSAGCLAAVEAATAEERCEWPSGGMANMLALALFLHSREQTVFLIQLGGAIRICVFAISGQVCSFKALIGKVGVVL